MRGRRLRVDEAIIERFVMSRVGTQFMLHVAPPLDKAVIPRTNGRLSSAGIDKVGLVTSTGAKSGRPRTHRRSAERARASESITRYRAI